MAEGSINQDALRATRWSLTTNEFDSEISALSGLVEARGSPTDATRRNVEAPLSTFFNFFPKALWVEVALGTNCYPAEQLD
ncbi:hypothetical protein PybrP1_005088 [[Pythium] brassicae (nom. inval.)]|nr:hypothetical protein PybrP1_005088 [[Pythium] brassicae (nom. inval.)]